MHRSQYLKQTALRWCRCASDYAIGDPWESTTAGHALDEFLDRYLYFLPVPRFRLYDSDEPSDEVLHLAVKEALNHLSEEATEQPDMDNFFKTRFPLTAVLRTTGANEMDMVLCACLMALRPEEASKLTLASVRKPQFQHLALEALQEDVPEVSMEDSAVVLLKKVHESLRVKEVLDFIGSLRVSHDSWVTLEAARGLYQAPVCVAAEALCASLADQAHVPARVFEDSCRIENLVSEDPTIGFDHPMLFKAFLGTVF